LDSNTEHLEIVMTDLEYLDRAEALLAQRRGGCDRINDRPTRTSTTSGSAAWSR
jgi:hypothetical protein